MATLLERISDTTKEKLGERTLALAKNTKEPRHAYIALQIPKVLANKVGKNQVTTGIATLNVEDQPGQHHILNDMLLTRDAVIICYGNFPKHNDANANRASKYKHHSNPNEVNPWDNLSEICEKHLGNVAVQVEEQKRFKAEIEARYVAQLEAKEREIQQLKGAQNGKESVRASSGSEAKDSRRGRKTDEGEAQSGDAK